MFLRNILLQQFQQIIFLQREDVDSTKKLLRRCARWYHSGELTPKCLEADPNDAHSRRTCLRVPLECRKHNAVYNILHYLVDDEFLPPNVSYRSNENVSMVLIKSLMISVGRFRLKYFSKQHPNENLTTFNH